MKGHILKYFKATCTFTETVWYFEEWPKVINAQSGGQFYDAISPIITQQERQQELRCDSQATVPIFSVGLTWS